MTFRGLEAKLVDGLGLSHRPVAIRFCAEEPADMPKFAGSAPSGCTFWRLASDGRSFYTDPAAHHNCPIGCYTHNISLPPERSAELPATIGLMTQIGYIRPEDIPGIERLPRSPAFVAYSPLGEAAAPPDVVLVVGPPAKIMLLHEAALRAGVRAGSSLFGRPTCMVLPASLKGGVSVSAGCIGNRIYTDLGDDELYIAIPAADLARVVEELETIIFANKQLSDYHRQRREELLRL